MPIKGFLKTSTMQNTHLELVNLHIDLNGPTVNFTVQVWEDDTKANLLHTGSYFINHNDPRWPAVLNFLQSQKATWMNAIESYLLARPEYADAIQE